MDPTGKQGRELPYIEWEDTNNGERADEWVLLFFLGVAIVVFIVAVLLPWERIP
jgi:hypothetical protein